MKKNLIIFVVIFTFLFLSTSYLFSKNRRVSDRDHRFDEGRRHFRTYMIQKNMFSAQMLLRLKDNIKLTDAQIKQISEMKTNFSKYKIDIEAKIKLQNVKLQELFNQEKINRKKIEIGLKELGNLKTDSEISFIYYLLDLKEVLTKEQIVKIETFKKERRNKDWHSRKDYFRQRKNR